MTLHLSLHSPRDAIPEAPAVYFCLPSEENLRRLGQDLGSQLYGSYYYNFISPISRSRLEELASAAQDDYVLRPNHQRWGCIEA